MRNYRGLTKHGKWVYGWYMKRYGQSYIINVDSKRDVDNMLAVIPETVSQQIGIKDNYKKEIYIGDKYKWYQPLVEDGKQIHKEHISTVVDEIVELYYLHNRSENCWGGVEIIGNVHHPKLIKK